jgi:excisionase family DNA binding protein
MTTELFDDAIWITAQDYLSKVRISKQHFYRLVERGEIPSTRLGRRILVKASALEDLENHTTKEKKI